MSGYCRCGAWNTEGHVCNVPPVKAPGPYASYMMGADCEVIPTRYHIHAVQAQCWMTCGRYEVIWFHEEEKEYGGFSWWESALFNTAQEAWEWVFERLEVCSHRPTVSAFCEQYQSATPEERKRMTDELLGYL